MKVLGSRFQVSGALCLAGILLGSVAAYGGPVTNKTVKAQCEWYASADATVTGYALYCSTNSFWQGTNQVLAPELVARVDAGTNLSAVVTNLAGGRKYYFVVTCYNVAGESDYSNELSLDVPKPPRPPQMKVTIQMALERSWSPAGPWCREMELPEYAAVIDAEPVQFYRVRMTPTVCPE